VNRDELMSVQTPLKERYRQEPGDAHVTLKATGVLDDGIACSVATGRAIAKAGLHPATGGDGSLLCSGDMLLEALVAYTDADPDQLETLKRLTERYCVVLQTLVSAPGVSASITAAA
jgi:hypothetical protein